jgi:hypothetical protein
MWIGNDCFGFSAIPGLPFYIRKKFECGFPDDWKEVKLAWEKYIEQGEFLHEHTERLTQSMCVCVCVCVYCSCSQDITPSD